MIDQADWKKGLANLFRGYIGQDTFEEASRAMLNVSLRHDEYHDAFLFYIEMGKKLANEEDDFVLKCINDGGGYIASTFDEARDLLVELEMAYLKDYRAAKYH